MMRVLDLFSGIGGFSLGLERAGMKTVAFCEIDPFCRRVLAKHWPDVPCHEDITKLRGSDVGSVDVVCGGPPCQPISQASRGRSTGTSDDRWLWPEMGRLIKDLRPSWFILENSSRLDGMGLDQIWSNMEANDYEVQPFEIPAGAVKTDHIRPRCWVVGYTYRNRKSNVPVHAEVAWMPRSGSKPGDAREPHGLSGRLDGYRIRALGNAVVPQIPEIIGRAIMQVEAP